MFKLTFANKEMANNYANNLFASGLHLVEAPVEVSEGTFCIRSNEVFVFIIF